MNCRRWWPDWQGWLADGQSNGYSLAGSAPVFEDGFWQATSLPRPRCFLPPGWQTRSNWNSEILGRALRVDDLTLGVSTQTLAEEAIGPGGG
ncbi:MAG: hypothetical protein R2844_13185 [Caldilineales bacterium]